MNKELIVVNKQVIGDQEVNAVDARALHTFLESKQKFGDWIKSRIDNYDFIENADYIVFRNSMNNCVNKGGRPSTEYYVTIDMAKELSMVEKTDRGKEARKYFIEMERKAKSLVIPDFSNPAEAARAWALEYEQKQKALAERDHAVKTKAYISDKKTATAMATASALSRKVNKLSEMIGDSKTYKQVKAVTWIPDYFNVKISATYAQIGKKLTSLSKTMEFDVKQIDHQEFGKVNIYHTDVIESFKKMLDSDANLMAKYRK